jgi:hypothetical protein
MEEKGLIVIWLEKVFGKSWRTSLYAFLALLPQVVSAVQYWCVNIGASPVIMNFLSLLSVIIAIFNAKDSKVTGINRPIGTGEPELKEEK